jgi:hypothetical protein
MAKVEAFTRRSSEINFLTSVKTGGNVQIHHLIFVETFYVS